LVKNEVKFRSYLSGVEDLLQHTFYSIDFESTCIQVGGIPYPCEVGICEFTLKEGELRKLHFIIDPGPIPGALKSSAEWTTENIHGIDESWFAPVDREYTFIWNQIDQFVKSQVLFAKGPTLETACLNWLSKKAELLQGKNVGKCKHHKYLEPGYHCALLDARMVIYSVQQFAIKCQILDLTCVHFGKEYDSEKSADSDEAWTNSDWGILRDSHLENYVNEDNNDKTTPISTENWRKQQEDSWGKILQNLPQSDEPDQNSNCSCDFEKQYCDIPNWEGEEQIAEEYCAGDPVDNK